MSIKRKYTDADLIVAVNASTSIREVLGRLGKSQQGGGSYNQIKDDIKRLNLDISHFRGKGHGKGGGSHPTYRLKEILVENSPYRSSQSLKRRLSRLGLLKNVCHECGLTTEWNGKPLVMVMDHINGINNDHRIENLRMLCPNCNSQQSTFAGRNQKYIAQKRFCDICKETEIDKDNKTGMCKICYKDLLHKNKKVRIPNPRPRKFEVDKETLSVLIDNKSFCEIGRMFCVSDNAIRKRAKKFGLIL